MPATVNKEKGFSMVEVLLAMMLLVMISSGFTATSIPMREMISP
mgnify:CR=1 FL=1